MDSKQLRVTDTPEDAVLFEPGEDLFLDETPAARTLEPTSPPSPYAIFTTAHDVIVHAAELPGLGNLRETREKLDKRQSELRQEMNRLVARLQRRLMAHRMSRWDFDLEDGLIDAAKLDRVIVNPGFSSAFKQETLSLFRDTCVTFLIDNSGSMRGPQIETACVAADSLCAVLEKCGIATEVLGFTTSAWKGGRSAKDWSRAGRPENPGRLNDLLHIIYKDAGTPHRRARDTLCAMLHPSLLKENIDGEALLWAQSRLMARPEDRKVLIVLSDGAPVDQASLDRNSDTDLLDRHLRHVIKDLETGSQIDLAALGIKHDVTPYYAKSVHVDKIDALGPALVELVDSHLL